MKAVSKLSYLALGAVVFSYLFTGQDPGFNMLVFLLLAFLMVALCSDRPMTLARVLPFAGITLLFAAPSFLYGFEGVPLFWLIWITGGATLAYGWKALPLAGINGFVSHILSPFVLVADVLREQADALGRTARKLILYGAAAGVFLVFMLIYAGASTSLSSALDKVLVFDFWFEDVLVYAILMGIGFVLLTTLVHNYLPPILEKVDGLLPDRIGEGHKSVVDKVVPLNPADEYMPAMVLTIALTVLATFAAVGDALILLSPDRLPDGVTYAQFLHRSAEVIVLAVVLVAFLAGFLFRDEAHHQGKFAKVRFAFYGFLAANLLLVTVAWGKNAAYIDAYSLTHLRIGLYVWLGLIAAGLVLTAYKLAGMRSFYWLIKAGSWVAAFALGFFLTMPTDRMVRTAQLDHPEKLDMHYLVNELSSEETYLLSVEVPDDLLMKQTLDWMKGLDARQRREAIRSKYLRKHTLEERDWRSENLAHRHMMQVKKEQESLNKQVSSAPQAKKAGHAPSLHYSFLLLLSNRDQTDCEPDSPGRHTFIQ